MSAERPGSAGRLIPLEAYRGLAALIVVAHHFFLGFSPFTTGLLKEARNAESWIGSPFFVFVNGTAAVYFFFVLSGFVLCWAFFRTGNVELIRLAFFKRWPRLAGPVLLTTIASYLMFRFHLYFFPEAAAISGSPWLASFANGGWTPEFHPSLGKALNQGLFTFFTGLYSYNTNLWTMRPEFVGSLLVFLVAIFIHVVLRYSFLLISGIALAAAVMPLSEYLLPFVVGVFMSASMARQSEVKLSTYVAMALIALGLYLLGYVEPVGAYKWSHALERLGATHLQPMIYTLGAALIIYATMSCGAVFRFMENRLAAMLGRLSFPLYLVHALVICSCSSFVFSRLLGMSWSLNETLAVTSAATAGGTLLCALPLMWFDEWWMTRVNDKVKNYFAT